MIQSHTTELLDRTPPSSLESEEALLGGLFLDPSRFDVAAAEVCVNDFYDDANRELFGVMETLHDAGKPIGDMTILSETLKSLGVFEKVGGTARLSKLIRYPTASNVIYYAKQVRKASRLRQQLAIGLDLIQRAYANDAKPDTIANWLDAKLSELSVGESTTIQSVGDLAQDVLNDIDVGTGPRRGLMTGFPSVDEVMGVFMGGETIVIGARPGTGKTAFAMQIAEHNARQGRRGLFVSLEMSGIELTQRLQCSIAGVNQTRVRNGATTTLRMGSNVVVGDARCATMALLAPRHPGGSSLLPSTSHTGSNRLEQEESQNLRVPLLAVRSGRSWTRSRRASKRTIFCRASSIRGRRSQRDSRARCRRCHRWVCC